MKEALRMLGSVTPTSTYLNAGTPARHSYAGHAHRGNRQPYRPHQSNLDHKQPLEFTMNHQGKRPTQANVAYVHRVSLSMNLNCWTCTTTLTISTPSGMPDSYAIQLTVYPYHLCQTIAVS